MNIYKYIFNLNQSGIICVYALGTLFFLHLLSVCACANPHHFGVQVKSLRSSLHSLLCIANTQHTRLVVSPHILNPPRPDPRKFVRCFFARDTVQPLSTTHMFSSKGKAHLYAGAATSKFTSTAPSFNGYYFDTFPTTATPCTHPIYSGYTLKCGNCIYDTERIQPVHLPHRRWAIHRQLNG